MPAPTCPASNGKRYSVPPMTDSLAEGTRRELERIRKTADLLSTAHASMSDRYGRKALAIDIAILLATACLTALGLADPRFSRWLVPESIDPTLWIGLLGLLTFCLTLLQIKTDWKGLSEGHQRTFAMYVEVKREAGYMLASDSGVSVREFQRLASRYDMASDLGKGIPEKWFLALKRQHRIKVAISKILDDRPGAVIFFLKFQVLWRDTWQRKRR